MLDDVLVSVQWGNWLIFLNDQNQARPVFSVLEVVFVQTGHDHCVITLIAHHTDHNLYCLEMFLGPTLTINNHEFADDIIFNQYLSHSWFQDFLGNI